MKKITSTLLLTFFVCSFAVTMLEAQKPEFVETRNKKYLKKDPKIGAELKEVSVFDEQGKTMKLGSTRGKYTVLIFGCLT